jgi:hypothetical protein
MQTETPRRAILGLVLTLLVGLALPATAQNRRPQRPDRRPGPSAPRPGNRPVIPAGSVRVAGSITALNAAGGTFQLTNEAGLSATIKTNASTVILRDGKTATLADLKPDDRVVVTFDRVTFVASRVEATSPPPTDLTGTITSLDTATGALQVTTDHGTAITLTANSNTQLRLNGRATTVGNLAPGQQVRVTYRPADKIALSLAATTPQTGVVSGAITALDVTAGTLQLTPLTGAAQNLKLNAQTQYRLNGRAVSPSGVAVGQLASVRLGSDNATAQVVSASTPPLVDLEGTITAVDAATGTVQVTTPAQTTITLRLGAFTAIQRNGAASTADKLVAGDRVLVRYEYLLLPNASRALGIMAAGA